MSHMVIFRTSEGKPGYQPAETIERAIEVVERLRNEDGVQNVRIFRLEELEFEYKPYYRVELARAAVGGSPPAPSGLIADTDPDGAADDEAGSHDDIADLTDGHIADGADGGADVAHHDSGDRAVDHMAVGSAGSIDASSSDVASAISDAPSWNSVAPSPSVFGDLHDPQVDEDELSRAAGARRGLFGR